VVTKHDGTLTDLPKGKDSASTQARNQAMKEHRIFHLEVVTCTNCGTWSEQSVKVPILGCLLRGVIACGLPYVLIKLAGLEVSLAVGISFGLAWLWQWWDVRSREKKTGLPQLRRRRHAIPAQNWFHSAPMPHLWSAICAGYNFVICNGSDLV
jgi:hypothetical protein